MLDDPPALKLLRDRTRCGFHATPNRGAPRGSDPAACAVVGRRFDRTAGGVTVHLPPAIRTSSSREGPSHGRDERASMPRRFTRLDLHRGAMVSYHERSAPRGTLPRDAQSKSGSLTTEQREKISMRRVDVSSVLHSITSPRPEASADGQGSIELGGVRLNGTLFRDPYHESGSRR